MNARHRPFHQVDVFTATPYQGNPLAVVLDGQGLSDEAMQRFARWTNLSETTFVLPPTRPEADYRVRIYTPGGELPFAGHPTLGSCHVWLQAGGQPRAGGSSTLIVQECGVGLVTLRRSGQTLSFAAPPLQRSPVAPALQAQLLQALGLSPSQVLAAQMLDNGPRWLTFLLDQVDTVLALEPDHQALKALGYKVGVAARAARDPAVSLIARRSREARAFADHADDPARSAPADLEVRAFAAATGVNEDPVTGSLNASLAQWLMAEGWLGQRYVAAQGSCLGRNGRVQLSRDAQGQVWVGGEVANCIQGQVWL